MPFKTTSTVGEPIVISLAGQPGLIGDQGEDGRSAYQIAVETGGYAGSEADFAAMLANAGSADATLTLIATTDLPGGAFGAAYGSGQVSLATPTDTSSATGVAIGYIDSPAAAGAAVVLRKSGMVRVAGAVWAAGDPIYVADYGGPTNLPRTSGWSQQVGAATGPDTFDLAIGPAEIIASVVTLGAVSAVIAQALTDVVRSLPLTMPLAAGSLWRSQTFTCLSPNSDGTPYIAPYGVGLGGALDPVTATLGVAVPRALRALPTVAPGAAGALWRNGGRLALTANNDGTAYPTTPLPTSGSALLIAVRAALLPWLADTMPALPTLPPVSSSALYRTNDHALALSL
ncbi:hypothetical protein DA075_10295 [Methylobacterium currus]|uniref:Uncharacterized protein n=1 Tax=Methylobacterium currus TaxID=2051553 RepID=A0A2R4WI77_9HYPH|nr:hypothetical protein [Methylobacterium currus]AWB21252.1 hypothetical protein DA075_10295 [Methylobacterium currus]